MKVILFGATVRECVIDPAVERGLAVGRSAATRPLLPLLRALFPNYIVSPFENVRRSQ